MNKDFKGLITPQCIFSNVLEFYVNRGFGSMNKNDFEVFIFSQLLESTLKMPNDQVVDMQSDYAVSIFLRIPESKVKRLRYEASLKYPNNSNYTAKFINCIRNAKYEKSDNNRTKVIFQVKDIALRKYIEDLLTSQNDFPDYSFNSNIIKLDKTDFFDLFAHFALTSENKASIKQTLRENSKEDAAEEVKNIVGNVIKVMVGKGASELSQNLVDYIADKLQNEK